MRSLAAATCATAAHCATIIGFMQMPTTGSRADGVSGPVPITSIWDKVSAQAQHGFGFLVGLVFQPNDRDSAEARYEYRQDRAELSYDHPSGSYVGAVGYGGVVSRARNRYRIRSSELYRQPLRCRLAPFDGRRQFRLGYRSADHHAARRHRDRLRRRIGRDRSAGRRQLRHPHPA